MMSMTCSFSFNHRICIYEVGGTKQDTKPISPYFSSFNVTVLADRKQRQAKEVTGVSHLSHRVYSTNVFLKKMKVCDEHTHTKTITFHTKHVTSSKHSSLTLTEVRIWKEFFSFFRLIESPVSNRCFHTAWSTLLSIYAEQPQIQKVLSRGKEHR